MIMRTAGNLPDHVTRNTHRNESRWLIQAGKVRETDAWEIAGYVGLVLAVPVIAWAAMIIVMGVICE